MHEFTIPFPRRMIESINEVAEMYSLRSDQLPRAIWLGIVDMAVFREAVIVTQAHRLQKEADGMELEKSELTIELTSREKSELQDIEEEWEITSETMIILALAALLDREGLARLITDEEEDLPSPTELQGILSHFQAELDSVAAIVSRPGEKG